MSIVKEIQKNGLGKDYFVGDVHGHYGKLMRALNEVNFDYEKDRLISVGDIIDRGPDSFSMIKLLDEPWFYCVRGNHEDMMCATLIDNCKVSKCIWENNGGQWWQESNQEVKAEILVDYLPKLNRLPHVLKIGEVYVLHAEYFGDINDVFGEVSDARREQLIWGRERIGSRWKNELVCNADMVIVGHTPVNEVTVIGNTIYIDEGVWYGRNGGNFKLRTTDDMYQLLNT